MTLKVLGHKAATELSFSVNPGLRDQVSAWWVGDFLIDAGGALTSGELMEWLDARIPEAVLIGHHHEDHSAGAAAVAGRGSPLYGSAGTASRMRRPARVPEYRARLWGQRLPLRIAPVPPGLRLRPVPLPGHSPDQFGYLDEVSGWLFSGDLVLRRRQQVALPGEDPWAMMASLRRAIEVDPPALATSHHSLIPNPRPVLDSALAYLEELAGRIQDLHGGGARVAEIVARLFGGEPRSPAGVTWRQYSRGEFSAARWVRSFLKP